MIGQCEGDVSLLALPGEPDHGRAVLQGIHHGLAAANRDHGIRRLDDCIHIMEKRRSDRAASKTGFSAAARDQGSVKTRQRLETVFQQSRSIGCAQGKKHPWPRQLVNALQEGTLP